MSSIEERVKKIVVEQLGVKEEEVTTSASFVDDLGADSLDTVELVMALEEEFECEIPDEEAEKITSVPVSYTHLDVYKRQLLHRSDLLGVFVRNLALELFFQRHHQLDGVERVGAEVVDERRVVGDFLFLDAELFDHDLLDALFDAAHG